MIVLVSLALFAKLLHLFRLLIDKDNEFSSMMETLLSFLPCLFTDAIGLLFRKTETSTKEGGSGSFAFTIIATTLSISFILFLTAIVNSLFSNSTAVSAYALTIFSVIIGLSLFFKLLQLNKNNPVVVFLGQTLFFIPCLLYDAIAYLQNDYQRTTRTTVLLVVMELVIVTAIVLYPHVEKKIYLQGGNLLTTGSNEIVPLSESTTLGTYLSLNKNITSNPQHFNYDYALSFWFCLDAYAPNTNASYVNNTNILSFGSNPIVKYNASKNTLTVTVSADPSTDVNSPVDTIHNLEDELNVKSESESEPLFNSKVKAALDKVLPLNGPPKSFDMATGDQIIYTNTNVLLQKWNNVIVNYNGGTLDIFYNGELVQSSIQIVPYVKYDALILGQEGGLMGSVANVVYYNRNLTYPEIRYLFNALKAKDPPIA